MEYLYNIYSCVHLHRDHHAVVSDSLWHVFSFDPKHHGLGRGSAHPVTPRALTVCVCVYAYRYLYGTKLLVLYSKL